MRFPLTRVIVSRLACVLVLVLAMAAPAHAQLSDAEFEEIRLSKVVTAVRIPEDAITLDGHLDEPVWQQAAPATDFFPKAPNNGAPSTERTEVRFLYDTNNLYVGFTGYDSEPSRIFIRNLQEDFGFNVSDMIQIFLHTLQDGRSGFTFVVNPAGARRDTQVSSSGVNEDWDGVWDVKVSRNDEAWFAEYEIPFKTLRFPRAPTQEWGLNITRRMLHRNEESNWAPVPLRYSGTRPEVAGTLLGLENIRQGRNFTIKPFVIGAGRQSLADGRLRADQDYDGGFDAKYGLTSSMTLDATFRTDFAQVEADQQQVNLTRFSLFFPEKRDFFLENSGNFAIAGVTGQPNNNLVPFFSRRIGLSATGAPIPILGGARVSGQMNNYDVGVLAMKTERAGSTPSNTYLVGRVRRNFMTTSWIGAIVTDRESALANDYNRVYGPDLHLELFERLEIDSFLLRSDTPDRSGRDQARKLRTTWRDDELVVSAVYNMVGANFNPEVGFLRRRDMSQYSGDISWRPQIRRSDVVQNLRFLTAVDYYQDGDGELETRTQEATVGIGFANNGFVDVTVNETFDRLASAFRIRPTVSIPVGDYRFRRYSAAASSGNNRKVSVTGRVNWGDFWDGRRASLSGGLGVRPNYHLDVNLNYSRDRVTLPNGSFTAQLIGARIVYGFTPRAIFNAFLQYNTDTHQVSSNLRFNFTHRPLSDIYLVYNDLRDTTTGQVIERAVIVKFTNLFSF